MATLWFDMATAIALETLPGIDVDEAPLVRAWLREHEADYDVVAFNVKLGEGRPSFGADSPAALAAWRGMTQLRADVVARSRSLTCVVEAKVIARVDAVTQLARYVTLVEREPWCKTGVHGELICDVTDNAVRSALAARGFTLEYFKGAES